VFDVRMGDPIAAGAEVSIEGWGGSGDDLLSVDAVTHGTESNIAAGAGLNVNLNGGAGNDTLWSLYEGEVDGGLYLRLDGGAGNDILSADATAFDTSDGHVEARVNGNDGHDILTLMLKDLSAGAADFLGCIDGGKDFDIAVFSPNVDATNCEA
jgi:Ca2+-binding RTX toxin-like protein